MTTLNKGAQAIPGEYLRFVWKVYAPLFCTSNAIEATLKGMLQDHGGFLLVSLTGGYQADVKGGRDYTTWEAIVRVGSARPAPYYGALMAGLESFNGSFACSTFSDAFQLISSEQITTAKPATSSAQTIADATTQQSEQQRAEDKARADRLLSAVKATAYGAIAVSLAYITGKLTGILR